MSLRVWSSEQGLCLQFRAPFHGDTRPSCDPGSTWQLWEFEVVELFVLGEAERYTEIELGPFGHYLVLRCEGRRRIVERDIPIDFRCDRFGASWTGSATIPWDHLPAQPIRLNAYCMHGEGAERRYLAWQPVPGTLPDFHRLQCFRAVDLGGPGGSPERS